MAETPKLRLYNTLTKAKEDFVPLDAKNVRMYVCGPTVYDFAHIGNARPVIVFDVLFRLLRHLYGPEHVTYARNITDIDDKINKRAFERWTKKRPLLDEVRELTDVTTQQYVDDVTALGNLPPTHTPRATDFVCNGSQPTDMVRVIERLVAKGHAYAAEGHVLFHVPSMPNYGRLSRRSLDDMIAGARVEVAPYKKDPTDFVLWKPSDPATEPGWDSPWGFGRPGWHIECSAMSAALLGETFDIHAGGIDLIFPHHENEIAQSCCAFGTTKMASVWMHNGFLQVEGQKMSKSLGNFFTIRDLISSSKFAGRPWRGATLRIAMLKTHYRQPIDWTLSLLQEAEANAMKISEVRYDYAASEPCPIFLDRLLDDLNTKAAWDRILELVEETKNGDVLAGGMLASSLSLLGLFDDEVAKIGPGYEIDLAGKVIIGENFYAELRDFVPRNAWTKNVRRYFEQAISLGGWHPEMVRLALEPLRYLDDRAPVDDAWSNVPRSKLVGSFIETRLAARRAKNFAESDRIRDELLAMGIQLKDGKDPATGEPVTTWEVKR